MSMSMELFKLEKKVQKATGLCQKIIAELEHFSKEERELKLAFEILEILKR